MSDLKDLNKPDLQSHRGTEVWQTVRGHIARLWTMDYEGMANLVPGMKRFSSSGSGDIKVSNRKADNSEEIIFDSSILARKDGSNLAAKSVKAAALDTGAAIDNIGNSYVPNATYAKTSGSAAKADTATSSSYASQVDWSGVIGKPTDLNAFTNSPGYLTGVTGVSSVNGMKGAVTVGASVGINQSWKTITKGRGVNYVNSGSIPIMVCISLQGIGTGSNAQVYINGVEIMRLSLPIGGGYISSAFIVQPGATYRCESSTSSAYFSSELS